MIFIAVEFHALNHLTQFTIYANMKETLLADAFKQLLVMPLTVAHEGRKQIDFALSIFLKDESENALLGVLHHALPCKVRIRLSRTGIEQTEEIVNFRHRAHRRTRILVRSLLLNANHRT